MVLPTVTSRGQWIIQVCAYDAMLMILTMLFTLQVWLKHNTGGEGCLESEVVISWLISVIVDARSQLEYARRDK